MTAVGVQYWSGCSSYCLDICILVIVLLVIQKQAVLTLVEAVQVNMNHQEALVSEQAVLVQKQVERVQEQIV